MTKNSKSFLLVLVAAIVFVVMILAGRDVFLGRQAPFDCGDGPRRTIDMRNFATTYSAYSLVLEASVDKATFSTKLSPVQLQQLSEAVQQARLFRQFVVAGYNSCAVNKTQYSKYGARFQALDSLARELTELSGKPALSATEHTRLAGLIEQYGNLAHQLASE